MGISRPLPRRGTDIRDHALALLDEHGSDLSSMARFLGTDDDVAVSVVSDLLVDAALTHPTVPMSSLRRDLSRRLYRTWVRLGLARRGSAGGQHRGRRSNDSLSEAERVAIALCWFGDHTFRDAAESMDLSVPSVLALLRSGLTKLADAHGEVTPERPVDAQLEPAAR